MRNSNLGLFTLFDCEKAYYYFKDNILPFYNEDPEFKYTEIKFEKLTKVEGSTQGKLSFLSELLNYYSPKNEVDLAVFLYNQSKEINANNYYDHPLLEQNRISVINYANSKIKHEKDPDQIRYLNLIKTNSYWEEYDYFYQCIIERIMDYITVNYKLEFNPVGQYIIDKLYLRGEIDIKITQRRKPRTGKCIHITRPEGFGEFSDAYELNLISQEYPFEVYTFTLGIHEYQLEMDQFSKKAIIKKGITQNNFESIEIGNYKKYIPILEEIIYNYKIHFKEISDATYKPSNRFSYNITLHRVKTYYELMLQPDKALEIIKLHNSHPLWNKLEESGISKYMNLDFYFNQPDNDNHRSISPLIQFAIGNSKNKSPYLHKLLKSNYGALLYEELNRDEDILILKSVLCHGNFLEKFQGNFLRKRITLSLKTNTDLKNILTNEASEYHQLKYPNQKDLIDHIIEDFTAISILKSLKNEEKDIIKNIISDFTNRIRICEVCNQKYRVINFPDWLYYNVNGNVQVCYQCPIKLPTREIILDEIKSLIPKLGFIPNSGFYLLNDNSFSVRINKDNWTNIFTHILNFGTPGGISDQNDQIKKHFTSWFHALVEAGVLDKNQLKSNRGIKCIGKSGNVCFSLDELYIDNWFFEKNIRIKKEPNYPYHPIYNPNEKFRADWFYNGFFIEYFGLAGDEIYDEKVSNKLMLCSELNLKLLPIYPSDLNNLDSILNMLSR